MKRRNSHEDERTRLTVDSRDRAVVTLLRDAARPLHVDELAERLVDREVTIVDSSTYERELERTRISLHHNYLPKLADDGVVEYDYDENVATYRDGAAVDAEWLDEGGFDELLARFRTGTGDENAVGVIEGRESVVEHGRRLADEADEELFCVYVSDDLLETECIRRAEDAIERDVDVYLGSQNPNVLDLTRERLPEVTLWERQLDWLNSPSRSPKVGRLVFADREKLMLGLLDESASGDAPSETAIIGAGQGNPLVALVRELLGPRLDHLDYQSTDIRHDPRFHP